MVATLQARGFSTLVAAVTAANLGTTLSGPGPFTVLAPTDAAFAASQRATLDSLLLPQKPGRPGAHPDLPRGRRPQVGRCRRPRRAGPHRAGQLGLFARTGNEVRVIGTRLRTVNIPCTNGVVQVIDTVLTVPTPISTTAQDLGFTTLRAALDATGLTATFADASAGPFTVFAPTDAASPPCPPGC